MGYHSDVAICLTKKAVDIFQSKVKEINDYDVAHELEYLLNDRTDICRDPVSGSEVWYWTFVKWYYEFVDVGFIEAFLNDLPLEEYRFIRIGENYDDTDVNGGFCNNPFGMELERDIKFANLGESI